MAKQHLKKFRKHKTATKNPLNWLWGQQSVIETLELGRWRVYELFATSEFADQHAELFRAKQSEGVELHIVSNAKLEELSQTSEHQGIVARVSKYPCQPIEELDAHFNSEIARESVASTRTILVVLDRVQDANQFASILRCCNEFKVLGVVIGEHCQSQVTTQIARACVGAVNRFPIFQSSDLGIAAAKIKELGFCMVAFQAESIQRLPVASLPRSVALMIGNETQGLAPSLCALSDHQIGIPILGKGACLPSTVAAGILLCEMRGQS